VLQCLFDFVGIKEVVTTRGDDHVPHKHSNYDDKRHASEARCPVAEERCARKNGGQRKCHEHAARQTDTQRIEHATESESHAHQEYGTTNKTMPRAPFAAAPAPAASPTAIFSASKPDSSAPTAKVDRRTARQSDQTLDQPLGCPDREDDSADEENNRDGPAEEEIRLHL
jgi:hypothetical protein